MIMNKIRAGKPYIEQEYKIVEQNYQDLSPEELADRLKRTADGVRNLVENLNKGLVEWNSSRKQVELKDSLREYITEKDFSTEKMAESTGLGKGVVRSVRAVESNPKLTRQKEKAQGGHIQRKINRFWYRTRRVEDLGWKLRWMLESAQVYGMMEDRGMSKEEVMDRLDLGETTVRERWRRGELISFSNLNVYDLLDTEGCDEYTEATPFISRETMEVLVRHLLRHDTKPVKNEKEVIIDNKSISNPVPPSVITTYLRRAATKGWDAERTRKEVPKK